MTKLVILDRDGVINEDSDDYVKSVDEWHPIPGSLEAIAKLKQVGFDIAIATNQSGIGRGLFSFEDFEEMCEKMDVMLDQVGGYVDGIFFCPHRPDEKCECRKPLPGLLCQIMEAFNIDSLEGVPVIGDSLRDLQAGEALGCHQILVKTGKGQRTIDKGLGLDKADIYADLSEAVDAILEV